jgi:hypothetical protein
MTETIVATATGANNLASQIREYWLARGYRIVTWIEPGREMPGVRSNLVNGLPVNWRGRRELPVPTVM